MLRLLALFAVFGFGALALSDRAERLLIYPFDTTRIKPREAGLPRLSEVEFPHDGETLIVWTAPPRKGKPTIFYLHGNAGNLAARAGRFRRFLDQGHGLIAPAYRGSSGSSGHATEAALSADTLALWRAMDHLLRGSTPESTAIYGESLGAAVAIALTAALPREERAAAILLEAPFTSLGDLASVHYPALAPYVDRLSSQWNNLAAADALTPPLLVLHGEHDALIPIEQGRRLFDAAPSVDKQWIKVRGAGHNDLWRSDVLPQILAFFEAHAPARP